MSKSLPAEQSHRTDIRPVCLECMYRSTSLILIDTGLWVATPCGFVDTADTNVSDKHKCFTHERVTIIIITRLQN